MVTERTMAARIVRVVDANPEAVATSRAWYSRARGAAETIAAEHDVTISAAAGMIAAWSPRVTWAHNVRNAGRTASGQHVPGLSHSRDAAERIRDGEDPLDVLRGPKTRAFYRNIMGDHEAVTVDVWAARVVGVSEAELKRAGAYDRVANAYRRAARALELSPAETQAIAWVAVRGSAE